MKLVRGNQWFLERLKNIAESKNGELLSKEYITAKTKYLFRCEYGHEFELTADKVTGRGDWCPYCAGRYGNFQKKYRYIIEEVQNGKMLSDYVNGYTPIKCKCSKGHIFSVTPSNLLAGKWCPKCNMSHGEKAVENYLKKRGIEYIRQFSFEDLKGKRNSLTFDFAVFEGKMLACLVEYDGEQHFRPMRHSEKVESNIRKFKQTQKHDQMKNKYCKDLDIPLIRISCFDVDYRRLHNLQRDMDGILDMQLSKYLKIEKEEDD